MAFRKIPSRKNGKRYKRFSSVAIKTSGSGPSTAAVFSGGRLIPESAKPGFEYRHRGLTSGLTDADVEEKIRDILQDRARIAYFFGEINEQELKKAIDAIFNYVHTGPAEIADPKLEAEDRLKYLLQGNNFPSLENLDRLAALWQSEFRQRIHYWNFVKLPIAERTPSAGDWLRLYFEGNRYLFVEKDLSLYRRSLIYTGRDKAYRDYRYKSIIWVERQSVPQTNTSAAASTPVP